MTKRKRVDTDTNTAAAANNYGGARYGMFANTQQVPSNSAITEHLSFCNEVLTALNPDSTTNSEIKRLKAEACALINAEITATLNAPYNNNAPRP